jgi:hypothetical protein
MVFRVHKFRCFLFSYVTVSRTLLRTEVRFYAAIISDLFQSFFPAQFQIGKILNREQDGWMDYNGDQSTESTIRFLGQAQQSTGLHQLLRKLRRGKLLKSTEAEFTCIISPVYILYEEIDNGSNLSHSHLDYFFVNLSNIPSGSIR